MGSREGADLEHVEFFVRDLHAKYPDSILVSGGADGVDRTAEQAWLKLGGKLVSLRPKQLGLERYAIETWRLGFENPMVYVDVHEPVFADYRSACLYRDMLIAESVTRLVAFYRPRRSPGAAFTAEHARNCERDVYEFEAAA